MRGNAVERETKSQILIQAIGVLRAMLPEGWEVAYALATGFDADIIVAAPDRTTVQFFTDVKPGPMRGGELLVEHLAQARERTGQRVLLIAPYLGPALRQRCEDSNINYMDLTGWCWIQSSAPAILLRSTGASRDPSPPRASIITRLSGASSSRVVRTLLATQLPVGVRELSQRAHVSASTVSKLLKELESETIVSRAESGAVTIVQKRHLIERWTRDYSFLKTNNVAWFLAPRGLQQVLDRAEQKDVWAVGTGSLAARRIMPESLIPIAALTQVALYVPSILSAVPLLGLVPSDRASANVLLAEPYDAEILDGKSKMVDHLPVTEPGQAIADLKTMPGRAPQEADQLMDFLAMTDEGWR